MQIEMEDLKSTNTLMGKKLLINNKLGQVNVEETIKIDNPSRKHLPKFKCALCTKSFKRNDIFNHYLEHKEEKMKTYLESIDPDNCDFFKCCICEDDFATEDLLKTHFTTHVDQLYLCFVCNKDLQRYDTFLQHMNYHRMNSTKLNCDLCNFTTINKGSFTRHKQLHELKKTKYKCDLCDKVFLTAGTFAEHENFHTGNKPFSCEECGKKYMYSRYLNLHKKNSHTPNVNICKICNIKCNSQSSFIRHRATHRGVSHLCDICGKYLANAKSFELHKRYHSGFKPHICEVCGKKFSKKDILIEHQRIHTGEKPFGCDTCGKHFSQRSSLKIHKRSHTGERPYVCHLCNKGYVSRGLLGVHLKQDKHKI